MKKVFRVYRKCNTGDHIIQDYKKMSEAQAYLKWLKIYDKISKEIGKNPIADEFYIKEMEVLNEE